MIEKTIAVQRTARYFVLGNPSKSINRVWYVFHGYGMNVEEFLKWFETIADEQTLVVAPEGLNRFYQKGFIGVTGANWMTKAMRLDEIQDHLAYLDAVEQEISKEFGVHPKVIFGFSQGAAIASRWFNHIRQSGNALVLWGGEMASELKPSMAELSKTASYAGIWLGDNDPFIPLEAIEKVKAEKVVGWELEIYKGAHDVPTNALEALKNALEKLM